jgi:hypothetical protein
MTEPEGSHSFEEQPMRKLVIATTLAISIAGLAGVPGPAQAGSSWLVSLEASNAKVVAGHRIVFTGTVRPKSAAAGDKVLLQEKFRPGKPWADQGRATIASDGTYRVTDRPSTNFLHSYRVVMAATPGHARGVSPTVKVKVYAWDNLINHADANDNGMTFGTIDINGTAYESSAYAYYGKTQSVEFNVNHQCIRLRGRFGVSDDSTIDSQAEVDVQTDGTQIYSHTFDVGQSDKVTLALGTPLKLRLGAHDTSTASGATGFGAFGSPQVLCTR